MEIILGIVLSLIISGGKRLGLSSKDSIQLSVFVGAFSYSVLKYYSNDLGIDTYLKDIAIISSTAIAFYEIVSKRLEGYIKL